MNGPDILWQMLRDRWRSLLAWSLGTVVTVILLIAVYPSVRETAADLDAYVESLPEALREAFGLAAGSISSPAGYLASQLYSNVYPVLILIMGIGAAAWTIAGSEDNGTLEMTLANPVRRRTVAAWRCAGTFAMVLIVTALSTAALALSAPLVSLEQGLPWWGLWSAGLTMSAMILVFVAITFAAGAATGRKGPAVAVGSTAAVFTFLLQVLAALADPLEWMRNASPWWWFLEVNPVVGAPTWTSLGLPVAVTVLVSFAGIFLVDRRDLRL